MHVLTAGHHHELTNMHKAKLTLVMAAFYDLEYPSRP